MRLLESPRIKSLWTELASTPRAALLLDYDGTLAPFHIDPAQARPYPGVETLLNRIVGLPGDRLILVSGRQLSDLRPLLALDREPEMWGCHGRERRLPDGSQSLVPLPEASAQALTEAEGWEAAMHELGGRMERKPGSLAFHWRGLAPARQQALRRDLEARFIGLGPELAWYEFDGGVELRAPGCDKGAVVRQLLAEVDAQGGACTAYLGDDHTDEDAFAALHGRGLGVLVRPGWRATAADVWLRPPNRLCAFLERWAEVREQRT